MKKKFQMYADCIVVKGSKRGLIYDFGRQEKYFIPLSLAQILSDYSRQKSIAELRKIYTEDTETIDEYIQFLNENELVFETDEGSSFPPISTTWDTPSVITNAIVEIHKGFDKSLEFLNELGCQNIEIRCFTESDYKQLMKGLEYCSLSNFRHIDIVLSEDIFTETELLEIFKINKKVFSVVVFKAIEPRIKGELSSLPIVFVNRQMSEKLGGKLESINLNLYTEASNYNTFYNRKIFINRDGLIKNAPECQKDFGSIYKLEFSTDLKEIIRSTPFQVYWTVHKRLCDVCKECEFMYMCTDNRVPLQRSIDQGWYFEEECSYNPYIAKWAGDEGYRTLAECGVVSDKNEFSINQEVLTKINKEIGDD